MKKFKQPLSIDQQISHLESSKKVLNTPNKISTFNILKRYDCTLNFEDLHTFESNFLRIVGIRNAVYHNNSLEILTRFYNFKNGELRNSSDQKKYRNLIKKLSV